MKFSDDAAGFVSIADEVPDVLLDIRYCTSFNFVGERIEGYEEPAALMTREAAQALKAVSDEAAELGFRLKIFDAYRPQKAVDHFMRWAKDPADIRMKRFFLSGTGQERCDSAGIHRGTFRPQPRKHRGPDAV
ncbi:MAG: M15 family metallopeptidase [Eubacteriales bacterium]